MAEAGGAVKTLSYPEDTHTHTGHSHLTITVQGSRAVALTEAQKETDL